MKPASAFCAEDLIPVDLTGLELTDSSVATVGAAEGCAYADASLSEVEAIACGAADAVVLRPNDVGLIDSTMKYKIFDEASYWVSARAVTMEVLRPKQRRIPRTKDKRVIAACNGHAIRTPYLSGGSGNATG
jgi:hypothetical protein